MRKLEISGIVCEGCRQPQTRDRWGHRCSACHGGSFHVNLERSSEGIDLSGLVGGGGGGELGMLLDMATDDVGGPGPYFRTHAWLECGAVSDGELAVFLTGGVEDRVRQYISWKRREIESTLPEGKKVCGRCHVVFTVYDNDWNRSGCCSKSCYQASLKSRAKSG